MSAKFRRLWSRQMFIWQSTILCIVLLAVACTNGDSSRDAASTGSAGYGVAASGYTGGYSGRQRYTEEEIGVGYLVDEYLSDRFGRTLTRYRTYEESRAAEEASDNEFSSLSVEARDRAFFEQTVRFVFFAAGEAMPPEVASAVDALYHALYDSLDLCAERSRWPDGELYLFEDGGYFPVWSPQEEADSLGIALDEYLDFRHECYKFAASYPSLNPGYRDELLQTRRDHYLEILRLWIRDHPEMVVPMTYEQSVNHPYQDYVREICRASDDPQECARLEGVTLE